MRTVTVFSESDNRFCISARTLILHLPKAFLRRMELLKEEIVVYKF